MRTKTSMTRNSICRSPLWRAFLIPFVLASFALSPQGRATCQDACLTNNNTVQGDNALISNTTGFANTAVGSQALSNNTTGWGNTATGDGALTGNTIGMENTAYGLSALNANGGDNNTAVGADALGFNTGDDNTAVGFA